MVQGDPRRPAELLANPEVRAHLDFGQPVAIGLFAILHFLRDSWVTTSGHTGTLHLALVRM
jgi:S-adenosyl methyltransferase